MSSSGGVGAPTLSPPPAAAAAAAAPAAGAACRAAAPSSAARMPGVCSKRARVSCKERVGRSVAAQKIYRGGGRMQWHQHATLLKARQARRASEVWQERG